MEQLAIDFSIGRQTRALSLKEKKSNSLQQEYDVLLAFARGTDMTDQKVADELGIMRTSVCGRRNDLIKKGSLVPTGKTIINSVTKVKNATYKPTDLGWSLINGN